MGASADPFLTGSARIKGWFHGVSGTGRIAAADKCCLSECGLKSAVPIVEWHKAQWVQSLRADTGSQNLDTLHKMVNLCILCEFVADPAYRRYKQHGDRHQSRNIRRIVQRT